MKASTMALPAEAAQVVGTEGSTSRTALNGPSPSVSMLRGAVALFSTQPVTWAAALLTTVFVPRYLGDQGLGQYSIASAAANMAGIVAALGVPVYLRRQVAAHPDRAVADTASALVLLTVSGLVVAVAVAVALPAFGFMAAEPLILQLALVHMVIAGMREALLSLLVGREQHGRFAWLNAASVVASAIAGVGALAAGLGVTAYIVTQIAVHAASMVPAWYLARVRLPRSAFAPRLWWQLVHSGAAFFGWQVALAIRGQTGVLMVGAMLSEQVAGWYFAAQRIAGIPTFIPVVLATPLFPVLSRITDDRIAFEQTLHRALLAVLILTILPSALVIGLAPAIPDLLGWQASFSASIPVMMILALFLPLVAFNMVLGTGLLALNRERRWLLVGALAAVINPAMNLVLIPMSQAWFANGAVGLAVAEVATEAFMLVGGLVMMPRDLIAPRLAWLSARIAVAGGCAAGAAMTLQPSSLILAVVAGGLAYIAVVVALRAVRPSDVQACRQIILDAVARRRSAHAG